jgi:hypothetical protein
MGNSDGATGVFYVLSVVSLKFSFAVVNRYERGDRLDESTGDS